MRLLSADGTSVRFSCWMVVLFHLTGLIGTAVPATRELFRQLAPWHLLVMFGFLVWNYKGSGKKFVSFIMLTGLFGYAAEWVGVHTHLLFGFYQYGSTLGARVQGIPAVMSVNWFMLIYCAGIAVTKFEIRNNWLRPLAGAFMLLLLDVLIERVAGSLDYWHFQNNTAPLFNYLCWFMVSFVLLALFKYFNFDRQNKIAPLMLFMQFLFFIGLNVFI